MPTTALYAAALAGLFIVLSARVIVYRRTARQSLGHGGNPILERRMRAQGNLAEYAPIALIMLMILETGGLPTFLLHTLGVVLLLGRAMHAWALSSPEGHPVGRTGGMALTLTMIGTAAILCLWVFVAA